eukprot:TRINITY_DN1798_c0_g1_i2.p1 TRINITY_DN1798_c0_g1~~TRINITY_DN1798_c0_g1_i2.p1  ORF type:complete len:268 (-),score=23.20 TRINITY_DN1798_c0_g1_i2:115-918(-)
MSGGGAQPQRSSICFISFVVICLSISFIQSATITTWRGDPTGQACGSLAGQCDSGAQLCYARMRSCDCTSKRGYETSAGSLYKQICNWGNIDGRQVTAADRQRCLSCSRMTCDGPYYPSCPTQCGARACISANGRKISVVEADSCPSNHQKNVAKCCMWGGAYCSCVDFETVDVNGAAMDRLGCGGSCAGSITFGSTCSATASSCDDRPPDSNYSCAQQKSWGKCNESWMLSENFCCQTCGRGKRDETKRSTLAQLLAAVLHKRGRK